MKRISFESAAAKGARGSPNAGVAECRLGGAEDEVVRLEFRRDLSRLSRLLADEPNIELDEGSIVENRLPPSSEDKSEADERSSNSQKTT